MFKLVQTCGACPELYDVYLDGIEVAYLRLRHGYFRADCGSTTVYEAYPNGDGIFEHDERDGYLRAALAAIQAHLKDTGTRDEDEDKPYDTQDEDELASTRDEDEPAPELEYRIVRESLGLD